MTKISLYRLPCLKQRSAERSGAKGIISITVCKRSAAYGYSLKLSLPEVAEPLHVYVLPLRAGIVLLVYCRRSMTYGYEDLAFQACFDCICIFCHVLRKSLVNSLHVEK